MHLQAAGGRGAASLIVYLFATAEPTVPPTRPVSRRTCDPVSAHYPRHHQQFDIPSRPLQPCRGVQKAADTLGCDNRPASVMVQNRTNFSLKARPTVPALAGHRCGRAQAVSEHHDSLAKISVHAAMLSNDLRPKAAVAPPGIYLNTDLKSFIP